LKQTTHLHLVPRSKNEWSYTFTPTIRLHGVVIILKKAQGQIYIIIFIIIITRYGSSLFQIRYKLPIMFKFIIFIIVLINMEMYDLQI